MSAFGPDQSHELAMPFVTVASQGGPHDDVAYVCGYEMGLLDAYLQNLAPEGVIVENLHAANHRQADLLAMRYGCTLVVAVHPDPAYADWIVGVFTKTEAEADAP